MLYPSVFLAVVYFLRSGSFKNVSGHGMATVPYINFLSFVEIQVDADCRSMNSLMSVGSCSIIHRLSNSWSIF